MALWILKQSDSYVDAVRKAVALGADADTLGAIVGGIAEAIWGIPEWLKTKAFGYLPSEMKSVLLCFRDENGFNREVKKNRLAEEIENDKLL